MKTKQPKLKEFQVTATVKAITCVTINAESLEDAIAKSKEMSTTDFIEFHEEHIDSNTKVTGVSDSAGWDID